MVDAVVSCVLKRIGDYLIREAVFLRGVKNEVELLKNDLEWMECFIRDAEEKQVNDAMIRKWVSDIRDIAYDIEDVLDTFMLKVHDEGTSKMQELDEGGNPNRRPGFFASIMNCSCISDQESTLYHKAKEKVNLYSIGKDIAKLKERISDLSRKRELYRLEGSDGKGEERSSALGKLKELRRVTSLAVEGNVVGFEDDVNTLMVIDDVWQKEAWEGLKRAFPDNKKGSRVIMTTRIKEVAQRTDEKTYIHELRFLGPDKSWELFCDKALQNSNMDEGLEKLGREMVGKCGGLPLALVVLGGLLSTKKPQEWRLVRDHILRHLRNDSIHISYLLALSFDNLPSELKLCFLYLGFFPEDFEIHIEKVIRLMVAEGFVQEDEDQIMEDMAEDNLNKLIDRSLVQIEKRSWGRVATCRVHDLLRDLAIEKAKELNFIRIFDEIKHSTPSSSVSSCRRQAVYSRSQKSLLFQHCNPLSRSVLFFNLQCDKSFEINQCLTPLFTNFMLLRVLNVEGLVSESKSLPEEIGKLIHLKYLGLRNACIDDFPPSIVNLQRLQTLDLYGIEWSFALPTEIRKLRELRHLTGNFIRSFPIDNLTNLQTLKYVNVECWAKFNPEKLVNLRELRIKFGWSEEKEFSLDSVAKLKSLQVLSVRLRPDQSFGPLQPLSHCSCLVDLRLNGKIEKLPEGVDELLPNLECLKLSDSGLQDDPMSSLEKLPNLMILVLSSSSYNGKKLICTANGFPRLEILHLDLDELEEWQADKDAMRMLRDLWIPKHSKLRIPESLSSIPISNKWEWKWKAEW